MGIVLKINGQKAPTDAPMLLRHALVNEASLMAHDFSNGGSFPDRSVQNGAELVDLSKEISLGLGIDNAARMNTAEGKEDAVQYTPGGGILISSFTQGATEGNPQGFNMGLDLPQYLTDKQPPLLAVFWVRATGATSGAIFNCDGESSYFFHMRRTSTFHGRLAGVSAGGVAVEVGKFYQYAMEFRGAGQTLRRYVDGVLVGEGSDPATGFNAADMLPANIGSRSAGNPEVVYYGGFAYDLSLTDKTASELVQENWDYINGTGLYAGKPTRRPFVDIA